MSTARKMVLSGRDRQDLERLERIVRAGIAAFHEVGEALLEIRDRKLYVQTHQRFEDYCREKWQFSRQRAFQLIQASEVVDNLSTRVDNMPTNEMQIRSLAGLPPETQAEVWQEAVEQAGGAQPTAADVAALAEEAQAALPAETQLRVIAQEEEQILRRAAGRASRDERSGRTKRLERTAYHLRQAVRLVKGLGGDEGQEVIDLVEQAQAALAKLDAA